MDYNARMDIEPGKKKGVIVTPDGHTAVPVAQVNPEGLPSDDFLAQLTDIIAKSEKVTQIVYEANTEEIVEFKEE